MSGIGHAFKKVFKGVGKIIKKVWKPLVIAAAIYFTGGAALGMMGAMSTGGGLLAGAGAGLSAAAGGIGIGAGAGITGAWGAGAGLATAGAGAAGAGAAALGAGGDALGSFMMGGAGAGEAAGAASGLGAGASTLGAGGGALGSFMSGGASTVGSAGGLWDAAVNIGGSILNSKGGPTLLAGFLDNYQKGKMLDQEMKWKDERAPGQFSGSLKDSFSGMPTTNPNIQAANAPQSGQQNGMMANPLPLHPIGVNPTPAPNMPQPGTPGGAGYVGPQPQQYQPQSGLLAQNPYMESPYDQSYA